MPFIPPLPAPFFKEEETTEQKRTEINYSATKTLCATIADNWLCVSFKGSKKIRNSQKKRARKIKNKKEDKRKTREEKKGGGGGGDK